MIVAIADTHAAIWYLFSDARLGKAASSFLDDTILKGDHIGVSAISIVEMIYLIEKGRIPPTALDDLRVATADPKAVLRYVPVDEEIALKLADIPRQDLPDLPDRVIAATALFYGVPVLSRDARIRSSNVKAIW
ncbi:MAG: type II toxin-antitoxin system VapC family toxin [Acidobacteriaceae bacterium]|nr:type II toxin-antitoxin system VapC family toxin [Acidobacteriaceae bacterium]